MCNWICLQVFKKVSITRDAFVMLHAFVCMEEMEGEQHEKDYVNSGRK